MFIVQIMLIGMLVVVLALSLFTEPDSPAAPLPAPPSAVGTADAAPPVSATFPASQTVAAPTPTRLLALTPTVTAAPSPTETPQREPILRTGSGDEVFYPQKWIGPAVVRITHSGKGPFVVWSQDDNGDREDELANTVGPFFGDALIDFYGSQRILRFEVRTAGDWHIEVLPLSMARHAAVPGSIDGDGNQAIVFDGPYVPDLLQVDASNATGRFVVQAFGVDRVPMVDMIGPYAGTVPFPRDTTAIAVRATGHWQLEITTR